MTDSEPRPAFGSVENYAAIIRGIAQSRDETYVCATALSSNIADGGGGVTADADRLEHIRNIFEAAEAVRDELRRQQDTTGTRPLPSPEGGADHG